MPFSAVYMNQIPNLDPSVGGRVDTNVFEGKAGITLELCAGIVDKADKSLADTAVEEVLEECGYKITADQLIKIGTFQ